MHTTEFREVMTAWFREHDTALVHMLIKSRMLEIGVTGIAPERRSAEYLARFVVDEVARWEGPIKSGGLQVD